MCKTCDTLIPLAGITIVVFAIAIALRTPVTNPSFTIETISATCILEEHNLDVKPQGTSIVINVPIRTPNPCYSIVGDVKFFGKDIEVDLSAVTKQDSCIACIGEVTGKVVIRDLKKGTYGIKINTPDKDTITPVTIE